MFYSPPLSKCPSQNVDRLKSNVFVPTVTIAFALGPP
jgi:hypothetical protein